MHDINIYLYILSLWNDLNNPFRIYILIYGLTYLRRECIMYGIKHKNMLKGIS